MRTRVWLLLFVLAGCAFAAGSDPEFKAGGVVLALPSPAKDFVESGDKLRTTIFELLVPSPNRLLSAYLPSRVLPELEQGKLSGGLDLYAMVEVPRMAEYSDCTADAFQEVLKGMPSLGDLDIDKLGIVDELNARLKSLGSKPLEVGKPEILGPAFRKTDAAGVLMMVGVKSGERSATMAMGMGVLRVKQRLIFAYLYRKYESAETVTWLRTNLEAWCDLIGSRNAGK